MVTALLVAHKSIETCEEMEGALFTDMREQKPWR